MQVLYVCCLQTKLGKSNAVCNMGLLYNERTALKEYQCQLSDPSIAKIIGPWLPISCTTGGADGSTSSSSKSIMAGKDR